MPIITDKDVKPVAFHTPMKVPLHWTGQVKRDLDRDVSMGMIEPVPINTPTSWCARMVVVAKHNGYLRRTVDISISEHLIVYLGDRRTTQSHLSR